ncbi:MAG: DUF1902 domain-containing protein [Selenomonadaceae bacterium]|nr:DUF1902 domain-containing protein [Selenomonadaceae bacterium]
MQSKNQCRVDFQYDNEAGVWIATSDDLTGLILESESPETLMKRVIAAAPELIELNNLPKYKTINFYMTRHESAVIA